MFVNEFDELNELNQYYVGLFFIGIKNNPTVFMLIHNFRITAFCLFQVRSSDFSKQ